jgi:putative PIN family toxin of toxin-antitoxin system
MLCVVLDTNIIVSGLWSDNSKPAIILNMALDGKFALFISQEVLIEYERVLRKDKFKHKFSPDMINLVLSFIKGTAEKQNPPQSYFPEFIDETDRKFYDLAKTANAYLITGNIKHYPQDAKIITSADFIKIIE